MTDSVSSSSISINSWTSLDDCDQPWGNQHDEEKSVESSLRGEEKKTNDGYRSIRSSIDVIDTDGVEVTLDISFFHVLDNEEEQENSNLRRSSCRNELKGRTTSPPPVSKIVSDETRPLFQLRRPTNALLDKDDSHINRSTPSTAVMDESTDSTKSVNDSCDVAQTPNRQLFCGSVQEWCHSDSISCAPQDTMTKYEWDITQSLASPVDVHDWCQGWQALSTLPALLEPEPFSMPAITERNLSDDWDERKLRVQRTLRSRAYNVMIRRQRLDSLRQNMNPFEHDGHSANQWNQRLVFGKTRSFNLSNITSCRSKPKPQKEKTISFISVLECGALDCSSSFEAETPATIRMAHDEQCYHQGYDSDPEDFTSSRRSSLRSPTNKENSIATNHIQGKTFTDIANLSTLVQDFMNEKITLLLHRNVLNFPGNTLSIAVHFWVERGQRLNRDIILPKLVWMPVTTNRTAEWGSNRILHQRHQTYSIELLDVSRILEITKIDRSRYPFVRLPCAFLVRTMNEEFVFEASTEGERKRVVETLKHVVARFASTVLLQDDKAILDFFSHRSQGPGEQPRFLSRKSNPLPVN